ncbi:MAG: aminotransferase class V-fold PLP-dependent enzyme [Acidobacteriota bacterium]|nr:aminotransferase class V-fold PLP-dependent enzyme [Acidobacteriota bacterium]
MDKTPSGGAPKREDADMLEAHARLARKVLAREVEMPSREMTTLPEHLQPGAAGRTLATVVAALDEVLSQTPSAASPRFLNQLFGGRDPAATLAEMLVPLTNTSMYTFKAAGIQILLEQAIVARMARCAGFPEGEGTLTPGGSLSNMLALMIACNEALADTREHGVGGRAAAIYTSDQGHYSIRKNAGVLGLGRSAVREIPSDRRGRMRVDALRESLRQDRAAGILPLMITATAGTTVLGAFDPIADLAALAAEERVWLHVDGALGASALLSPRHRHLLDGLGGADSLTWNAHKMMGVPLSGSVLLLRRRGLLARHLSEQADYLFQADADTLNPGTRSIQCGRRNDALKLWAAWLYHGDEGYGRRIERLFALARHAARRLAGDPAFELLLEPESVNVCFRVRGHSSTAICEALDQRRLLKIGHGEVLGRRAIRLVCVNPDLGPSDIDAILDTILQVASTLPAQKPPRIEKTPTDR